MALTGNTHTWTLGCKPSGLPNMPVDQPTVLVGPEAENVEITVTAGQNLQVFSGLIDHTKVISFALHSSLVNVTAYTNSSTGAGGQSFVLGTAAVNGWNSAMPMANPLTADITGIWVDNTGGAKDTVFRASFLSNVS
jgi:hypothetical protein